MSSFFGGMSAIVIIFLIILSILWFLLPFAVFGIKGKLDEIIEEKKKTNQLLKDLVYANTDNHEIQTTQDSKDADEVLDSRSDSKSNNDEPHVVGNDDCLNKKSDRIQKIISELSRKKKGFSKSFKQCEICQNAETGLMIDERYICESCNSKYLK